MSSSSTTRRRLLWHTLLLLGCAFQGCSHTTEPKTLPAAPFFATDYHLPEGQPSDSLLAATIRQGVLDLTPLLAAAPTWPAADTTVRAFLEGYAETEAYAPLAQIAARAMIRHRLLADPEAMSTLRAEVLYDYLTLMYDQGSRDLALMERGVDSLYALGQDSVLVQWQVRLEALAPPPPPPEGAPPLLPLPERLDR